MRRILLLAIATALLVGAFAGVASARLAGVEIAPGPKPAPFRAPASMPTADKTQTNAYGFQPADAIGAAIAGGAAGSGGQPASGGASASVTVTAIVLPVVFIVVDTATGDVAELFTNTDERDARGVVYVVRSGGVSGAPAPLTASIWSQARAALAEAHAGNGSIWAA